MSRWRVMSSWLRIFASHLFSLFWRLDNKGERRVIFISVFSLVCVVCNMDKNMFYVWLVIL
jgi:hypothetical protein